MFSPEALLQQIHDMEHGPERLEAIAAAIRQADDESAHYWRIHLRYDYVQESVFHGDNFKAIICFPELLKVFDEHPEYEEDTWDDIMLAFKWVLDNMTDYYQITREEIERYYEEYSKRCKKFGITERVYYMKLADFLLPIDKERAKEAYDAFRSAAYDRGKRGAGSDCKACEANYNMRYSLIFGQEEEALRFAAPILSGELRCAEIPHETYSYLCWHYLYKGDLSEALYYGALAERLVNGEPEHLDSIGTLLELYSVTDPNHGWKLLKENVTQYLDCHNPYMQMCFATGAYRVLHALPDEILQDITHNPLILSLPIKSGSGEVRLKDIHDHFEKTATELSQRFDERNGSSYYMDLLRTQLKAPEEESAPASEEAPAHSLHGLVQRAPSILAVFVPEQIGLDAVCERVKANAPDGFELITCLYEEEQFFVTVRYEERLYEAVIVSADTMPPEIPCRPFNGLDREGLQAMLASPARYAVHYDFSGDPFLSYHILLKLLHTAFPDMAGVVDLVEQKAYPETWVRFVSECRDAVTADDLFGLYIAANEEETEIWITTVGMRCMGLRELEAAGVTPDNFNLAVDILCAAARAAIERGVLPDEGEVFTQVNYGEEPYEVLWQSSEKLRHERPEALCGRLERELPGAVLYIRTDEGDVLPAECTVFEDYDQLDCPNSRRNFMRRIRLAKQSFPLFAKAVQHPFERAAVRMEFQVDEELADEYGYSIELLWCEIDRVEDGRIIGVVADTSEAVPAVKEGDEVEIVGDRAAGWAIQPQGFPRVIYEDEGALLLEVGLA
ncbi:MAG: DUF4026 domain-containing protein [Oscillospiraceae bacterium]|nr:DUF4026 domain-containing protein [Oscillospiraceae bacterium]